jgi:hypothetical protein
MIGIMSETMPGIPFGDAPLDTGMNPIAEALLAGTKDDDDSEEAKREEDLIRIWFKRISNAKKQKQKWEDNYEIARSFDYVRGFQRDSQDELDAQGDRKYQINKILAALKTRIPALFYYFPYVRVKPSYGRADSVGSQVHERAQLLQDTINTIVRQKKTRFKPETMMGLKEAHWAFGVTEVGYTAEWGENPFISKPTLVESDDVQKDLEEIGVLPEEDSPESEMAKLEEVPHAETFYVKHIPQRQFYVATNDRSATESQDWLGYWEWMFIKDVKRCESFENTEDIKATAKITSEGGGGLDKDLIPTIKDDEAKDIPPDMVRVWKIWDQREKKRYVLAEGHDRILKVSEYYYLPLSTLRFEVMPGEWYPIPPIFNQLTEQDEFNDSREWLRIVRKGTRPRYIYDKGAFTADELEKLETDEFFTMIAAENGNTNAIVPVQMPQISDAVIRTLMLSDSGFAEQSASSPVDRMTRGAGGKPTATEVEAMGSKGDVRDSYEQQEVAEWLSDICTALIKCALEKMTLPQWVVINSDPTSQAYGMETQLFGQQFSQYMQLAHANLQAYGIEPQVGQLPGAPPPDPMAQGGMPPPMDGQEQQMGGMPPQMGQEQQMGGQPEQMMPQEQGPPEQQSQLDQNGVPIGQPIGQPSPLPGLPGVLAQQFQQITPEQLQAADDGMMWDVTVDVESLSPVTEEQHGNRLIQALTMIASPGIGQMLALSPPLAKTVLNLMGIRNSNDQGNIFMALQQKTMMEQQAAMAGAGQPPGVAPQGGTPSPQPGAGTAGGPQPNQKAR